VTSHCDVVVRGRLHAAPAADAVVARRDSAGVAIIENLADAGDRARGGGSQPSRSCGETRTLIDSVPNWFLRQSSAGGRPSFTPVPFSEGSTIRATCGMVYVTAHVRPKDRIHDPEGKLERVLRVLRRAEPVSCEGSERLDEARAGSVTDPQLPTELRRAYEKMPIPDALRAIPTCW
jgi:hypothetical protein